MKQWTFSCLKKSVLVLLMLLMALAFTVITVSADDKTPTRTGRLDLTQYTQTEDKLDSEGWKYEPSENGGTLTLRDFYLKGDHTLAGSAYGLIHGKGTITIVLEGTNMIETTSDSYNPLIGSGSTNNVSWIIKESENKGTLELINGSGSVKTNGYPYGFSGVDLTIESGTIVSNMEFCAVDKDFTLMDGSLTITAPKENLPNVKPSSIYAERNTIINGGTLKIPQGYFGINTGYYGDGFILNGGNVQIDSSGAAILTPADKQPKLKGGYLVASGGIRATNTVIDTSEYQGEGFTRGSANLDGSDAVAYDPENYKTYKWIEFPHIHKASGDWISNDTEHWKLCSCGEKLEVGEHSFGEWKVVKEAAVGVKGEKARQCEICGFEEKQDIPAVAATDSDNGGSSAKSAKTGDYTNLWIPFLLTLLSAAGIAGTAIMRRKSS